MRRILFCIFGILSCVPFFAQGDPVVMTVNGNEISKSEFEYFFRKNNIESTVTRKTVRQYADLYLNFKLKVEAAIDEGMDKSESFLSEYRMYRDMQAEDYLVDKDFLEQVARNTYDRSVEEVEPLGLVHLFVMSFSPKDDTPEAGAETLELVKSVYEKLESGESFQDLARRYSGDDLAKIGGEAGWVSAIQLPEDVAEIVYSLEDGQHSKPFFSDGLGFIVMVDGHRSLGSYDEYHDLIYKDVLESEAFGEAKRRVANRYASRLGWTIKDDAAVAHLDSVLEDVEPDFGNISREYHDGLLLFDISNKEIWEKITSNPEDMEAFYNANRKKFRFTEPCFKGMVFFCRNENVFNDVKSALEGVDIQNWIDSVLVINKNDIRVRVMRGSSETGLFRQGQNAYVDKIVFGKGEYEPMDNYPYVNVLGRVIKEPDSMQDVAGQVAEEYQKYLEDEWVKKLRKKYKYKIYKKELKKVSLE